MMFTSRVFSRASLLLMVLFVSDPLQAQTQAQAQAQAQAVAWRVTKSSGAVSVTRANADSVSLKEGMTLDAGDTIKTDQTGRALLQRGSDSILLSPNSVISLPANNASMTTAVQRAGSILFEVEKRGVKHFSVDTPFLAAVVKGTQFRVTVDSSGANVEVLKGLVEVTDFKSGKFALVSPNQAAKVSANGSTGLLLSGAGTLAPIQQGAPRAPSVTSTMPADQALPKQTQVSQAQSSQTQAQSNQTQSSGGSITPPEPSNAMGAAATPAPPVKMTPSTTTAASPSSGDGGPGWLSKLFKFTGKDDPTDILIVAGAFAIGVSASAIRGIQQRRRRRKGIET